MVERLSSSPSYRGSSPIRGYARLIALMGLVLFITGIVVYFLNPVWNTFARIGMSLGLVLLLAAVLLRPDAVRTFLAGRPVKYASNALVMTLAFLGILGLLNFLAAKHNWEYDLTENGQFTLSEQTIKFLRDLDRPVHVVGFFKTGDPRQALAKDYLKRCGYYTDQLTYEFHDPNVKPGLAESYKLSNYGLIFTSGSNTYEAYGIDEQTITSSLIRVTSDRERVIYFVIGHGEPSIDDSSPGGYSRIREAMERENYRVETLNLAAAPELPPSEDAVMVLAGAQQTLLDLEVAQLKQWLTGGGQLMILADPLAPVPARSLLAEYGLTVGDDLVADEDNYLVGFAPTSPLIVEYPHHEITRGLNGFLTFFPLARSLTLAQPQPDQTHESLPILTTGPNSWAEKDPGGKELHYDEGVDAPGPIHIGVVVEDYSRNARLIVLGSASFILNRNLLDEVSNRDLFMNAINWLTEDEELIAPRPKNVADRRLLLTPLQNNIIIFTSLMLIPLVVLFSGAAVWWQRR